MSRSGPNIPESARHTAKLTIRVHREMASRVRAIADRYDLTLGRVLEIGLDRLETYGELALAATSGTRKPPRRNVSGE